LFDKPALKKQLTFICHAERAGAAPAVTASRSTLRFPIAEKTQGPSTRAHFAALNSRSLRMTGQNKFLATLTGCYL